MTSPHPQHLTWDDLDDLLMGTERPAVHVHLETCVECRKLAAADLDVVAQLQRLPELSPRPGFADRVVVGLAVSGAAVSDRPNVRPSVRLPWLKAAAAVLTLGSLGTSLGWSLANQNLLLQWRSDAMAAMRAVASALLAELSSVQQSAALEALRTSIGGVGVGLILTTVAAAYLAGLLSLQRLVTVPDRAP